MHKGFSNGSQPIMGCHGLMVMDSGPSDPASSPGWSHCSVVFLGKARNSHKHVVPYLTHGAGYGEFISGVNPVID